MSILLALLEYLRQFLLPSPAVEQGMMTVHSCVGHALSALVTTNLAYVGQVDSRDSLS